MAKKKQSGEPQKKGGGSGAKESSGQQKKKYPADHTTGEFRSSTRVGTALVGGVTFGQKALQYAEVDGMAIFEGDIELGPVEQVRQVADAVRSAAADPSGALELQAVIRTGQQFRWPDCRVPFEIDSGLANQARVRDAIAHWEANTPFRFIERTPANAAQFPDFVTFVTGSGCSSAVGRLGGQQFIRLAAGCSTGNAIHEIGHAIGLWHEQSREDRDLFVRIEFANIISGFEHNFDQHITDGDDVGNYDYRSIMHYPRDAFSANGQDTIVPLQSGVTIGQRTALSAGDIAAANSLCAAQTLKFVDDGATLKFADDGPTTLKFVDERPTLKFSDDVPPTLKFVDERPTLKVLDDRPTVKFTDDVPPTLKFVDERPTLKVLDDRPTVKFTDDGGTLKFVDERPTLKFSDDASPGPGLPGQPSPFQASAAPFILSTPHHSMAWTRSYPEVYQEQVVHLESQLQQLHELLVQAAEAESQGALGDSDRAQVDAIYQQYLQLQAEYEALTRGGAGG